ncbi:hypothetical protein [Ornithinibacillus californiensis]|uniref:hypothetical protein n=1 Tax=Ornithinibacillus californiensis TaxID=161536 RepID=UPI00064D8A98|nr:hypothetical protein [Ornithinibacillus californiensis]
MSENNRNEENIKEYVTKEFDSIKVPKRLKEELWTQVKPARKKRILHSNVLPYIAAIACIAIFIPLVLSILPSTSQTASNDLSGQNFKIAYIPVFHGNVNNPGSYDPIMTIEFIDKNVFTTTIYGEGTYEFKDNELVLQFENENEYLEINFTLEESDKDFSKYAAKISDVKFEMENIDEISYFNNLLLRLNKDMPIEFLKR